MLGRKNIRLYPVLILIFSFLSGALLSCGEPPSLNYFNASPTVIRSGQAVTLQWDASGTTRVIISGVGAVAPSGTAIVTPMSTTTYILTVPNSTQSLSVTVEVKPADVKPAEVITGPNTPEANSPAPAPGSTDNSSVTRVTLKYDNLDSTSDAYLSDQIAIWHTYAKLPGSNAVTSAGYSADVRQQFTSSGTTGIPVKSPLIILPSREGMVCVIKNYSKPSYQYFKLGVAWYYNQVDEADRLKEPGWGLMTTFSPGQIPFRIEKLNIAGAANITDPPDEYGKRVFVVRILDDDGRQIWTKVLPWSLFRNDSSGEIPKAVWRSIDVNDLTVNGDFSVEVLTESNEYRTGKQNSFHYLALACERVINKNVTTRSIISDDGSTPSSWVRLYDQYGTPLAFNLCIRVEGSYSSK